MKFRHSLLSVSIASALALFAQQAAQAADETVVKVGFAAPLTGVNAGYGKDLQNGVQLALDDAVAQKVQIAGKPAHFNLVVQDDQADPRIGVQAAQALVDQNVSVVIGHFNSGTTIPASVVYDKAGIPVIDPAATNPTLTSRGLANMFMVIATDGQNAGNAGKYAVDVTKAKRIAIIDDR
ncbi:extracellular ligand-binding receptor, partial [Burkholderia sp. TJI49]